MTMKECYACKALADCSRSGNNELKVVTCVRLMCAYSFKDTIATPVMHQGWADCEIFRFESSPDPIKLNPIQSWSAKLLKIISSFQSWSANIKSCIYILPQEAKQLLELFCL